MVGISVAVVLFGAPAVMPIATAGAATIGGTRAQLDALQAAVQAGAARIHQLTLAFDQANLDAVSLAQQVAADRAAIAQLQTQVAGSESLLRRQAILSYTGGMGAGGLTGPGAGPGAGPVAGQGGPAQGAPTDPSLRAEYLQVAAGTINDAVDAYRTHQRQLAAAEASLAGQERASQAAAAAAGTARQQALDEASTEQAQLVGLQTQLGQLEAAAALAAARQRQMAEAQLASAAQRASTSQGLPVNNGLVTVVRSIVSPPAPPPPSTGYQDAGGDWLQLRECESSDNYAENSGNGYYGAYQFSQQTWTGLGYPGRPDLASHQMQDQAAQQLQSERGWGQWPACSAALGLT